MALEETHSPFRTTCWTKVQALHDMDEDTKRQCLEELVSRYWPSVYAYLRRQKQSKEQAAEITQSFFADVVLGRGLFEKAAAERGRLRSLILRALQNFQIDTMRHDKAREAGRVTSMDAERIDAFLGADDVTCEEAFHRVWRAEILRRALWETERHFIENDKPAHWKLFEAHDIHPTGPGGKARPVNELGMELGFTKPGHARSALQVVRERLRANLVGVVGESVGNNEDLEAEIRDIQSGF